MKKLLLAILLLAVVAAPAFAAVQNVKVSGSIENTYLNRQDFTLGLNGVNSALTGQAAADNDVKNVQSVFFTQTKLGIAADLTDNVSTTVELLNERVWTTDNPVAAQTDSLNSKLNVNLAYVTLKEMLYSPLTVIVGRQPLQYGTGLIIGKTGNRQRASSALTNVANDMSELTGYDAVRAILDYKPLTLDMFYTVLTDTVPGTSTAVDNDRVLSGINASYELGDKMNTLVEAYFFNRSDRRYINSATANVNPKADTVNIFGGRVSTNPIESLNLQFEAAHQGGNNAFAGSVTNNKVNLSRDAWALELMANYKIPVLAKYKPMASYVFDYFSGATTTATDSSNSWTGWDPMNEAKNGGKIFNSLFSQTNYYMHQVALSANPLEDVMAKVSYTYLQLVEGYPNDTSTMAILQPNFGGSNAGTTTGISPIVNGGNRSLGQEVDLDLTYNYTEDVTIGANLGYFSPGTLFNVASLADNNKRVAAKQAMVSMKVNF
ncbi:MAG: alginate export family protein [Candidatus Omnitrophica bacterium]|nr:alginate export family protein [Candidatus Omnitrophota bacterium]